MLEVVSWDNRLSHRVECLGRVNQKLLVQHKGLGRHSFLGVGQHLLGKRQDFGLRKGGQGLSGKHGSLKNKLGDLGHPGLEQRQRELCFEIIEVWDLALKKWHYWRFRQLHHIALRNDGLLSIGDFHHFRLKERQHHSGLSKGQDVLWENSVRDGLSIRIEKRLWLDKRVHFVLAFILEKRKRIFESMIQLLLSFMMN